MLHSQFVPHIVVTMLQNWLGLGHAAFVQKSWLDCGKCRFSPVNWLVVTCATVPQNWLGLGHAAFVQKSIELW